MQPETRNHTESPISKSSRKARIPSEEQKLGGGRLQIEMENLIDPKCWIRFEINFPDLKRVENSGYLSLDVLVANNYS